MSAKQDRQGVRTAAQLEQKWKFGESFAEVYGIATDAQKVAREAEESAKNPATKLTQDEIFNLLTNNGESEGVFRYENGKLYINASYIAFGILSSKDGKIKIDLSGGIPVFNTGISTNGITVRSDPAEAPATMTVSVEPNKFGFYEAPCIRFHDPEGNVLLDITEDENRTGSVMSLSDDTGNMATEVMSTKEQTGITLMYAGNEPHGYLRMDSDSHIRLKCDVAKCKQIEAPSSDGVAALPLKLFWEGPYDWGYYRLCGAPLNGDDDFFDPSEGLEPYTSR